jgi:hypothetical protein
LFQKEASDNPKQFRCGKFRRVRVINSSDTDYLGSAKTPKNNFALNNIIKFTKIYTTSKKDTFMMKILIIQLYFTHYY